MNTVLAERAWKKAGDDDYLRGAVCYYRGFSKLAEDKNPKMVQLAFIFEDALRRWVQSDNEYPIEQAMKQLGRGIRRKNKPLPNTLATKETEQEVHWTNFDASILNDFCNKPEVKQKKQLFEERLISVKNINLSLRTWPHEFDEETLERMRKIHSYLVEVCDWVTYDNFVKGFYHDMNPYSEIQIWERIGESYNHVINHLGNTTLESRQMIYSTLVMFANGVMHNFYNIPDEVFSFIQSVWENWDIGPAASVLVV